MDGRTDPNYKKSFALKKVVNNKIINVDIKKRNKKQAKGYNLYMNSYVQ